MASPPGYSRVPALVGRPPQQQQSKVAEWIDLTTPEPATLPKPPITRLREGVESLTVSPEPRSRKRKHPGTSQSLNTTQEGLGLRHPRNDRVFANPYAPRNLQGYFASPRSTTRTDTLTSRLSIPREPVFPPLRINPPPPAIEHRFEPAPHKVIEIDDNDDGDVSPFSMVDSPGRTDDDDMLPMLGRQESPVRRKSSSQGNDSTLLDKVPLGFSSVTVGKSVELDDGTLLRVGAIKRRRDGEIFLQGRHLVGQSKLRPMMPDRMNEVVWMSSIAQDHFNEKRLPSLYEIPFAKARKVRQIVFTNVSFNDMHAISVVSSSHSLYLTDESLLFCRWKNLKVFSGRKLVEEELRTLWPHECDEKARGRPDNPKLSNTKRREQWHGAYAQAASYISPALVTMPGDSITLARQTPKYTFGDAFCGAGGASRGADMAGLHVDWGFDLDQQAMESYRANFYKGTRCVRKDVSDFLADPELRSFHVDVLHMSFPCQAFSAANTTPNEAKNDQNQAPIFSCGLLLAGIRPRIATVEEADGLFSRHRRFFDALVCQFVDAGYSVRWAVLRCDAYGVPQGRRRVCMIAAGYVAFTLSRDTH